MSPRVLSALVVLAFLAAAVCGKGGSSDKSAMSAEDAVDEGIDSGGIADGIDTSDE
jgi:hypothetical protein